MAQGHRTVFESGGLQNFPKNLGGEKFFGLCKGVQGYDPPENFGNGNSQIG